MTSNDELTALYVEVAGENTFGTSAEVAMLILLRLPDVQVLDLASEFLGATDAMASVEEMAYERVVRFVRQRDSEEW